MFMPFSLGKNQDRTIWSENKIRWRNYCKVRFPCFLSTSSFGVSLIFLFCICLLERDEMREVQASKFFGKHGHNLASYGEIISFHIFFPPTRHFSWHTRCCIPGFSLRCFVCISLTLYISCILFRNRAVSEIKYFYCDLPIWVKTKLHLVKDFWLLGTLVLSAFGVVVLALPGSPLITKSSILGRFSLFSSRTWR